MARDIYTADMGNPPVDDEGAPVKKKPVKKEATRGYQTPIYTAEMGNPPSPDEGPTVDVKPRVMPKPVVKPKPFAKGGSVGSASRRADGIAQRGKTKGRLI